MERISWIQVLNYVIRFLLDSRFEIINVSHCICGTIVLFYLFFKTLFHGNFINIRVKTKVIL